ncbi:hypothetical protein KC318_g20157, partial [Hortaea werneckii]
MALPTEMNAWVAKMGHREPFRSRVPVPDVASDGLLVQVEAMGVCHSDFLGHEGAGKVVKIGPDVNPDIFSLGDRVAIHLIPGCNKSDCLECSRGLHVLCKADGSGNYGLGRDGMFAEYVACQARAAVKVPDAVEMPAAAVAPDAVLTAYQAVKYTGAVQPDHTIVIFGLGGVGLNGVQTALHLGVKRIL